VAGHRGDQPVRYLLHGRLQPRHPARRERPRYQASHSLVFGRVAHQQRLDEHRRILAPLRPGLVKPGGVGDAVGRVTQHLADRRVAERYDQPRLELRSVAKLV
jgi:hypothetical protein